MNGGPAPAIRIEGLTKSYRDGTLALQDIDLAVPRGRFLSLIGPSGCGKSTLLRLIAGLSQPTWGRIEAADLNAGQDMGVVFQDPTLMPWASIEDNVALPFRLGSGERDPAAQGRVASALSHVGLAAFAAAYPRQLSGGMRMRVALARALVTDPAVLLMDEPFGALDEITRDALNDDLLRIQSERDVTVVFVTHSVAEAVYLSDEIVVMRPRPGRLYKTIAIRAPAPDRTAGFRLSESYMRQVAEVSAALREASAREQNAA